MIHPSTQLSFINEEIGYGVIATEFIPAGTITWSLDKFDIKYSLSEYYTLESKYQELIDFFAYQDSNGDLILSWDHDRYINHSFNPNCMSTAYKFDIAIRDIHPGEELLSDYGTMNLDEPFLCFDEGYARKAAYPDDIFTYHQIWDEQVANVFHKIAELPQPLKEIIIPETWNEIEKVIQGKHQLKSILTTYFDQRKALVS